MLPFALPESTDSAPSLIKAFNAVYIPPTHFRQPD